MFVDRATDEEMEHAARLFLLAQAAQPCIPWSETITHPLFYVLHESAREAYRSKKLTVPDVMYFNGRVAFRSGLDRVRSVSCAEDLTNAHLEMVHAGMMECMVLERGVLRSFFSLRNHQKEYFIRPVNLFSGSFSTKNVLH